MVEEGTPAALLQSGGVFAEYAQARLGADVVLCFARGLGRTVLSIVLNGVCFEGMVTQRLRDLDM